MTTDQFGKGTLPLSVKFLLDPKTLKSAHYFFALNSIQNSPYSHFNSLSFSPPLLRTALTLFLVRA